ncbi:hypothetical protein ACHQM5_011213 [Ranunculus cassubicifolius]
MGEQKNEVQQRLFETELEAENLLLARHQIVENDRVRNGNREALTALRKIAKTTKTSVPSPFELMMKEIEGIGSKPLVKESMKTLKAKLQAQLVRLCLKLRRMEFDDL